ncbi:trypsin-like serine protease [Alphaproteobacteria bacterium]|nr:trypsin-like serine protease [Alphaproteobacteria bacterium]
MALKFIIFSFLLIFHFSFGEAATRDQDPTSKSARTRPSKAKSPRVEMDPITDLPFIGDKSQAHVSHSDLMRRNCAFSTNCDHAVFHTKKLEKRERRTYQPEGEELPSPSGHYPFVHCKEGQPLGFLGKIGSKHGRDRGLSSPPDIVSPASPRSRGSSLSELLVPVDRDASEGHQALIPADKGDGAVKVGAREYEEVGLVSQKFSVGSASKTAGKLVAENYVAEAPHKIIGRTEIRGDPYKSVVKLEMVVLGEEDIVLRTYLGSGVLIGGKYVLTAAHNLFFRQYKTGPSAIRVFLGRTGDHAGHETQADQFIVHPAYVLKEDDSYKEFDVGLIVLEESIGDTVGWLPYVTLGPDMLLGKVLSVVGYPAMMHTEPEEEGVKPSFQMLNGHTMYEMLGKSTRLTSRQLFYLINTYGGHSGSPILKFGPEGHVVCGIHTYGGDTEDGNCGTWISPDLHALIEKWIAEFTEPAEEETTGTVE